MVQISICKAPPRAGFCVLGGFGGRDPHTVHPGIQVVAIILDAASEAEIGRAHSLVAPLRAFGFGRDQIKLNVIVIVDTFGVEVLSFHN